MSRPGGGLPLCRKLWMYAIDVACYPNRDVYWRPERWFGRNVGTNRAVWRQFPITSALEQRTTTIPWAEWGHARGSRGS